MRAGSIRLNRTECLALGAHLLALGQDDSEEFNEIEIDGVEPPQILVNGAFLHTDGEWATFPDGGRE